MRLFLDAQKSSNLHFIFMKSLPYRKRMLLALCLMVFGFFVEIFISLIVGLVIMAAANSLSFTRGFKKGTSILGKTDWRQVTPDEYYKVRKKNDEIKRWDRDFFDITNPLGVASFVIIIAASVILVFLFIAKNESELSVFLASNVAAIILPHWFIGIREYITKNDLIIKIKLLEDIIYHLNEPSDIQVLPMLGVKKLEGKHMPNDARLMVRQLDAPGDFMGMQVQVAINRVEGSSYPYLYCVLVAKPGKNFFIKVNADFLNAIDKNLYKKLVFTQKQEEEADILVIRQETIRNKGYYTREKEAKYVVDSTLKVLKKILDRT